MKKIKHLIIILIMAISFLPLNVSAYMCNITLNRTGNYFVYNVDKDGNQLNNGKYEIYSSPLSIEEFKNYEYSWYE